MTRHPAIPNAVIKALERKGDSRICLVGASSNPEKYGSIILNNLTAKGYAVVPVNPKAGMIDGIQAYPSVQDVPGDIAIVNFVVPPAIARTALGQMVGRDIDAVWFQDGSFDEQTVALAKRHFRHVVYDACIMVVTNTV
mgnify:CR=1 FL=1